MAGTTTSGPTRALIVANPVSGSHSSELVRDVERICASHLERVAVHLTTGPHDAEAAVRRALRRPVHGDGTARAPFDLVVAVGGDGTVREVAQGLVAGGGGAALAIVPSGTGNSSYRMLWEDRPWEAALSAVLQGARGGAERRRLDLAELRESGNFVFLGACAGVIAEALLTARRLPLHGRSRYARAYAETAGTYTPYPGRVTVDGHVLHEGPTTLANVGGGRYRGGQYLVLPHSRLDDGLLDICVVGAGLPVRELPELTRTGAHLGHPATTYGRGEHIVVERLDGKPLPLEHDGEYQESIGGRATFLACAGLLPVWVPVAG
ncbi:diacylglycerol/lipid kinase family protein [Streptomyces iconiensis]|uniref:Diacylglycerol kinase family protein n=1 Tax=Streptomyces iconiensis TaxID=1384038 RepID=A0ABT7A375_9ACTN|nr:diacylglycerol kinase family protein [Streptomyces iconiensis]MDJ1135797.1 diacylglycerol kinase family protein [Streptomyces iconiensis]